MTKTFKQLEAELVAERAAHRETKFMLAQAVQWIDELRGKGYHPIAVDHAPGKFQEQVGERVKAAGVTPDVVDPLVACPTCGGHKQETNGYSSWPCRRCGGEGQVTKSEAAQRWHP